MHSEILRELGSQRGREMRDQAHRFNVGRMASKARRARRRGLSGLDQGGEFVIPAIPDYVDGSFHVTPTDEEAASQPGRVPTTGRAA
jgi:hypothetical protein